MKPFLKWAGNKYRIIDRIRSVLPEGTRLIEPFAGSAAVFLNTDFAQNLINDVNPDLVNLYWQLQRGGASFVDACASLFTEAYNTPEAFYALRDEFNETSDDQRKAVLFVYLNRHGYNGLCRYNRDGQFNVPFGRYLRPYFPYAEMMYFHKKAAGATFSSEPFETVMRRAQPGDVVYADPPYVPLSNTANFTKYSAGGFDLAAQHRLARTALELAAKGIPVLISNHMNDFTLSTYAEADITTFEVQRFISRDGKNRSKAAELLALFKA